MEQWLPIPGYEGRYWVSSEGSVRSRWKERLSPKYDAWGYPAVCLYGEPPARRSSCQRVHVLVALAFIGPRPEGKQVRHLDGNPRNCAVGNIAYGTPRENNADKLAHGTHLQGSACPFAKLTEEDAIRALLDPRPAPALAAELGVAYTRIGALRRGQSFRHVSGPYLPLQKLRDSRGRLPDWVRR